MNSKGSLGSIVAGVIAIFLILICAFYLSFTWKSNQIEKEAQAHAASVAGTDDDSNPKFIDAYQQYMKDIADKKVFLGYTGSEVRQWGVNLGLDLKGGMNVTLQVNMGDLLRSMANDPRGTVLNRAINSTDSLAKGKPEFNYIANFIDQYREASPLKDKVDFATVFPAVVKKNGTNASDVESYLAADAQSRVESSATAVLRNRIDAFGVVSPNIQVIEGKQAQILLELPGVKDHDRMLNLLRSSAVLEFYEMHTMSEPEVANAIQRAVSHYGEDLTSRIAMPYVGQATPVVGYAAKDQRDSVTAMLESAVVNLPKNLKLAWSHKPSENTEGLYELVALRVTYRPETGDKEPAMTGENVTNAKPELDQLNRNVVSMEMNSDGAREWGRVTEKNVGKPVAIVLDNEVYSYPSINEPIRNGRSQISGNFTFQDAQDLSNVLKSGRMTARVDVIESMVVGPSLGAQAVHNGIVSFIVALVLLMIFMIAIYGVIPGLIANLGLILNIFFIFGILASFQAVLTLSGIAGIVLSLGMAVDANVLIFERAKEELRAGKNARTAIADGYSNAFSAIFDSNLTSIITGVILMLFGTGPIKGFATTLIIGLCCSFFTAVYLTRIIFVLGAKKKAFQNLTFCTRLSKNIFANANYNFLGARKISFTVVFVVIAGIIGSLCVNKVKLGIDFSGGRNYIVKFDGKVDPQEAQQLLAPSFGDASLSVISVENKNQIRISTNYKINESGAEVDEEIANIIKNAFPEFQEMSEEEFSTTDTNHGIISSQKVGPTVANDMRQAAYIAVGLALLAMFLYILIRFRNVAFSLGALAAVAFTAFCIVGLYSVCYGFVPFTMEIDQTFIAAILTVIGYQINDTVVVFDRVRENIALSPKANFSDIINRSINSTLGRTVMTSLSTLIVLLSIFILGGEAIRSFSLAMIVGVVVGTLATIFVATPVAYLTHKSKK